MTTDGSKTSLQDLILAIRQALGATSGLACEDVNHEQLIQLMQQYKSSSLDWERFAFSDIGKNYTRNLIDDTNGKSNVLILVWNPGKGSPIHDHADAHCIMKILRGKLQETQYEPPETHGTRSPSPGEQLSTISFLPQPQVPQPKKVVIYHENEVAYISDKIGLHRIENASSTDFAVSMHLYTPPHAANYGFNIYDAKSGKKSHVRCTPCYSTCGQFIYSKNETVKTQL